MTTPYGSSGESLIDDLKGMVRSEEQIAMDTLFPSKDELKMLQMMNRVAPRMTTALSVLGFMRRRFNSDVLRIFQEELTLNNIAREGFGRAEAVEVLVGIKKAAAKASADLGGM